MPLTPKPKGRNRLVNDLFDIFYLLEDALIWLVIIGIVIGVLILLQSVPPPPPL